MSGFVADYGPPSSGLSGQTATGTNQATAFLLTKRVTIFSSVPSGTGAVLPSSYAPGVQITIGNRDAANSLNLYPGPGDRVETAAINAPVTIPIGGNFTFVSFDPPLSAKPRTWWQTESYSSGGYLPLAGGEISGNLKIDGTLTGSGGVVLAPSAPGTLDNVVIGGATPLAIKSTTLTATSTVSLSPANQNVTLSPTGTGIVTIGPATAGSMDNVAVGLITPRAATVTTLTATGSVTFTPASGNVVISPAAGTVTINPSSASTLDNVAIGQTTPLAIKATTLAASGAVTGAGFTARFASPGAIGNTVASTGAFTTLSATGALTGAQRAFLSGLTTSRSSATVLAVSAGECADSTNAVDIQLGAFTKSTAGVWAVGSGSNGMGTALTIANTTWYHVFAIINAGVADVYFDTSVTAANKPASTTAFRRIGSFLTNGSAQIIAFIQDGDTFQWSTPVGDINIATLGAAAVLQTLSVPLGVRVIALMNIVGLNTGTAWSILLNDPNATSNASNSPVGNVSLTNTTNVSSAAEFAIYTNTSQQVRAIASAASTTLQIATTGWIDPRGRTS